MPRDYKHQAHRTRKRRGGPPAWVWLLAGLGVGLFVAFLVYLKSAAEEVLPPATVGMSPPASLPVAKPKPKELPVTPKPVEKNIPAVPKPRFDFYNLLPEMEVVVPEEEITGSRKEGVRQVDKPGIYLLQAGSFRTLDQADRLKAQLALMGLETSIQSVKINGNETWLELRVGPFNDLNDLHDVRVRLKSHNIDAILKLVKE